MSTGVQGPATHPRTPKMSVGTPITSRRCRTSWGGAIPEGAARTRWGRKGGGRSSRDGAGGGEGGRSWSNYSSSQMGRSSSNEEEGGGRSLRDRAGGVERRRSRSNRSSSHIGRRSQSNLAGLQTRSLSNHCAGPRGRSLSTAAQGAGGGERGGGGAALSMGRLQWRQQEQPQGHKQQRQLEEW
jgi:hypothetical protein